MKFIATISLLFLYIYDPRFVFLPVDSGIIVTFIAINFSMFNSNFLIFLKNIFTKKLFFFPLISLFLLNLYYLILIFFSGYDHFDFRFLIMIFRYSFELPFVSLFFLYIIYKFKTYKYNNFDKLSFFFICISVVQSIISLLMFFNHEIRQYIFFNILFFTKGYEKILSMGDFSIRGFGISKDYLFATPLFQGFVSILALLQGLRKNYFYYFYFIIFLFIAVINARIALINLFLFPFCFVAFERSKLFNFRNHIFKSFTLASLLVCSIFLIVINFNTSPTVGWIIKAFSTFSQYDNNINILLKNHLHFPSNLFDILFGKGLIVFSNPYIFLKSDIGYVINIYFGGLFSVLIFFIFPIFLFFGQKNIYRDQKLISLLLLLLLIFAHFKGNIFAFNSFTKIFFIYYLFPFADLHLKNSI